MRLNKSYSDAELSEAIRNGSEIDQAIRFMYEKYYELMERLIKSNSGNAEDAEDIFQEVILAFIEMVQKNKYRGEASVKSMFYTLTRNLWITELRKRNSTLKRNEYFEGDRDVVEQDVTDYLAYKENQKYVLDLFEQLGDKCKEILTLFYFEGLSMKEILDKVSYQNEQVLRNKKYKCVKELIDKVQGSPSIFKDLKTALQNAN